MNLYDDPTDDLGPSEWRTLVLYLGLAALLFAVIALIGLATQRWWPWLLA